jgi:hypothetical protein
MEGLRWICDEAEGGTRTRDIQFGSPGTTRAGEHTHERGPSGSEILGESDAGAVGPGGTRHPGAVAKLLQRIESALVEGDTVEALRLVRAGLKRPPTT